MKKILIITNEKMFDAFIALLNKHKVCFILVTQTKTYNIHNNTLVIYYFKTQDEYVSYIMEENIQKSIVFDAIFSDNIKDYSYLLKYAKVIITSYEKKIPTFSKIITYGFSDKANVTYSSIITNKLQQIIICIQNAFKTLYQTQMIEFEFEIQTNKIDSLGLNDLLGIITLALFLDLRFEKNEFINYEKENLYVQ